MSGGTWDYGQHRVTALAEWLEEPDGDGEERGLPTARQAMAVLLRTAADLVAGLDYHFAGDSPIEHEQAWLLGAGARLQKDIDTYFLGAP